MSRYIYFVKWREYKSNVGEELIVQISFSKANSEAYLAKLESQVSEAGGCLKGYYYLDKMLALDDCADGLMEKL